MMDSSGRKSGKASEMLGESAGGTWERMGFERLP